MSRALRLTVSDQNRASVPQARCAIFRGRKLIQQRPVTSGSDRP